MQVTGFKISREFVALSLIRRSLDLGYDLALASRRAILPKADTKTLPQSKLMFYFSSLEKAGGNFKGSLAEPLVD